MKQLLEEKIMSRTMPSEYKFITFSDINDMRNKPTKSQIRRHAMKDIGVTRRRPRNRKCPMEIDHQTVPAIKETQTSPRDHLPFAEDDALYQPYIRAMSCTIDPFSTASIPIDATVHGLLRYFVYYSSNFPNNLTFTPHINDLLLTALRDELLIHCILSAAASRFQYAESSAVATFRKQEVVSTQESVKLLQNAVQKTLNQQHSPTETERLVNCMLYLGAGAIYRQDFSAANIHIKAAVELTELMGGINWLQDPQVLLRVISLDDLLACHDLRPCRLKPTYDPGSLPFSSLHERDSQGVQINQLPDGFKTMYRYTFPDTLNRMILRVLECHLLKCYLEVCSAAMSSEGFDRALQLKLRVLATRNRLLAFQAIGYENDVLRITLILCTLLPPGDPRQIRTAQDVALRLRSLLEPQMDSIWEDNDGLKLWCLVVGYFSTRAGGSSRGWFANEIGQLVHERGASIGLQAGPSFLVDLISFQRQFVFEDLVLRPLTEALAQDVLVAS